MFTMYPSPVTQGWALHLRALHPPRIQVTDRRRVTVGAALSRMGDDHVFFSNREDLIVSDFWSSVLGEYHVAKAEGGGDGRMGKKGIPPSFDDILLHRALYTLGSTSDSYR